ncbi:hypothetical protein C0J52_00673 [Blattella germanica]|nr:hypothetical protein C0J52_00673 [Blattella germanica]
MSLRVGCSSIGAPPNHGGSFRKTLPQKESTEKKKKWSLGGLFRRRKKEVGSESSSQDEEDEAPKKGFLARRRSRREKRKPRTNKSVGTFDHIVVNPLTQTLKPSTRNDVVSATEELNGCARDANGNNVMRGKDLQQVDDVNRREFLPVGSVDRLSSRSSRESFQRHARQDSSLSWNSSGGSGSLEQGTGTRRGRRAVKARAEALRDRQKAESSSEEGEVSANSPLSRFKSDDTLSVSLQREGSLNRRSRIARTERYIKRLSRDEESVLKREAAELEFQRQQRLCKSDAEGNFNKSLIRNKTVPSANRWIGTAIHHESSDLEHPRMFIRGSSATPSPGHSPLVRHKNLVHYTNSAPPCPPTAYDGITSTFPPGHSMHYATPVTTNSLDRKTPQHNSRPHGPSPLAPSNKSAESIPTVGIPRARINDYRQNKPNYDYGTAGRSEREYIEFQQPGQRSLSYDSNIHCVMPNYSISASGPSPISDPNDVMIVQFPVARLPPNIQQSRTGNVGTGFVAVKQGAPPPPPPRDPQRRIICSGSGQDSIRPISFACDNSQHRFQQPDFIPLVESGSGSTPFTIPALRHPSVTDTPVADIQLTPHSQRRSNSDNQLATLRYGHQAYVSHPHSFNPIGRPRPSSVTPESMRPMAHQQQHSSHGNKYIIRTTPSPDTYTSSSNQSVNSGQQQFQYYADQQPRSRRPIHIQYNASTNISNDQPYLSDSQVVLMKPPHQHQDKRHPMQHATEFWRQKDQEGSLKHKKAIPTSPRLQIRHINRSDRSRSNSPRPKELPTGLTPGSEPGIRVLKASKVRAPPLSIPSVRPADSLSSLSGNSDVSSPMQISTSSKFSPDIGMVDSFDSTNGMDSLRRKDNANAHRPLSMVLEKSETPEHVQNAEKLEKSPSKSVTQPELLQQQSHAASKAIPPTPPARRYSRQSSTSSLEAADWMSEDVGTSEDGRKKKRRSSNLEDALTELEAIYNSLKLGDEDLLDRAERRDLPIPHQKLSQIPISDNVHPLSSSWSTSRGAESDSGYNYSWGSSSFESLFDGGEPPPRRRAPSLRRSGIPDKVMDDMAYRRLHPKERPGSQDIRNVVSQSGSYLESSPAAAAADVTTDDLPQKPLFGPLNQEPDVTLDDVVFRNIRHSNNTLKVLDPQPPFGIPVGPIAPAPNSDYLHAVPGDTYRSMFKPRKIPDVVKDDLAYRNLRKDDKDPSFNLPLVTDDMGVLLTSAVPTARSKNDNFSMRKRRAVRSLSANIQSLVNRESLSLAPRDSDQDFEKAQSLSDLPDALQVAQKILEGKEVIGGGSIKIRNLTSDSPSQRSGHQEADTCPPESRRYCGSPGTSWVERANLAELGDRSSFLASTSTETLTDSRANLLHQETNTNKRGSWQHKLKVFIPPPPPNTTAENDDVDASGDGSLLQRPPPPPTPERNSRKQMTDNHQKPPPPPTPERSSSRRPSLDQSKILASLVHPVSVDRESPRQIQNVSSRPTPPLTPNDETSALKATGNVPDRRSARNSREIKIGKSSPLTDETLPFPEAVPGSPLDEKQLEELLSALAREARATSEKLEKELEELGGDAAVQNMKANKLPLESQNTQTEKENETDKRSNCTKESQENSKSNQKYGEEPKLHVEEEKIKLKQIINSAQNESTSPDAAILEDQPPQCNRSGNNKNKDDCHTMTQEEASSEMNDPNIKENVKLPCPTSEPTAHPVLVVEEECESEDNSHSKSRSEHSIMDDEKLSSSSCSDNYFEKQSLGVHEDLPFIDSSDRKSMSKSPINVQITDTKEPSFKCDVNTLAESDGAICNNDSRSEAVCRKSKIPVKVKRIESDPLPVPQDTMESQECSPCEVRSGSKQSEDKQNMESAISSVPVAKDIAAGGDVSSDSVVKEEGEDLGASAPSTSSAAGWYCLSQLEDPANVLVACSYCIACAHQIVGLDFLTVLGIILAIISLLAAFVL